MKKVKHLIMFLAAVAMMSCSNDSEDDLVEAVDPSGPIEGVAYNNDVQSIMQNACVRCHASTPVNGAPFSLVNFGQVNQRANGVLNRMSLQNGAAGAMPPSGRLPQATIDVIKEWIDAGKPEN